MDKTVAFLQTYKGRDRVLRLLCYSSKFFAGSVKSPQLASQLDNFGSQLSYARTTFRLLDDIPTLVGILNSSRKPEETLTSKIISRLEDTVDIIFGPLDHISWAIDHKIILSNSTIWDTMSTICWIISLYLNIIKITIKMMNLSKQKLMANVQDKPSETRQKLRAQQWYLEMSALKCMIDLVFAVNALPKGMFWSRFFNKWQTGAMGTVSSAIALYLALV